MYTSYWEKSVKLMSVDITESKIKINCILFPNHWKKNYIMHIVQESLSTFKVFFYSKQENNRHSLLKFILIEEVVQWESSFVILGLEWGEVIS